MVSIEITMWEFLIFGFFQAVVIALIARKIFKNINLIGPLIMWKSRKGLKFIDEISKKHKDFWRSYGDLGIILAFGFIGAWYVFRKKQIAQRTILSLISPLFLLSMYFSATFLMWIETKHIQFDIVQVILLFFGGFSIYITALLAYGAYLVISGYLMNIPVAANVGPALPGIMVKDSPFQIPWYGWLVFPLLIFVHEFSHGILARLGKFPLKSVGVIFFGVLPFGAFVEPNEEKLRAGKIEKQLRVYSVGSTANYFTSFFFLALLVIFLQPLFLASNLDKAYLNYLDNPQILSVFENSDAFGKLKPGMKIISINGSITRSIDDIHNITKKLGANSSALIETDKGNFTITLNEQARIGLRNIQETFKPMPLELEFIRAFLSFIGLIVFFNFIIGVMNLLPMFPLDGALMTEALLSNYIKKKSATNFTKLITYFILLLFLINILPLFFPNY